MRNYLNIRIFWAVFLLLQVAFVSCHDDNKNTRLQDITGTWNAAGIVTDNTALNELLFHVILPSTGFDLSGIKFVFMENERLSILLPVDGTEPVTASYAYDDKRLALRFDKLPVPFNAFYIKKLTDSELVLNNTIPGELMEIVWDVVKETKPELEPLLETVLAPSLKNGLEISIMFSKSLAVLPDE